MIEGLVVNGCSYMDVYAQGNGHRDLAEKLNLLHYESIAQSGCSNSRIIRTTLKHSYNSSRKNLYVLGMTFISRSEAPILCCDDPGSFEGRWTNPQNQIFRDQWEHHWTEKDTEKFVEIKIRNLIDTGNIKKSILFISIILSSYALLITKLKTINKKRSFKYKIIYPFIFFVLISYKLLISINSNVYYSIEAIKK